MGQFQQEINHIPLLNSHIKETSRRNEKKKHIHITTTGLILNQKSYDGVWCGGWGQWWLRLNISLTERLQIIHWCSEILNAMIYNV